MKKKLSLFNLLSIFIIFLPIIAEAGPLAWSSSSYDASASREGMSVDYGYYYVSDSNNGPPLPVSANADGYSQSLINDSSHMNVDVYASGGAPMMVWGTDIATATFTGNFTASLPFLEFSYSLDYNGGYGASDGDPTAPWSQSARLIVTDLTTSNSILNSSFWNIPTQYIVDSGNSSKMITIPTPVGHIIDIMLTTSS